MPSKPEVIIGIFVFQQCHVILQSVDPDVVESIEEVLRHLTSRNEGDFFLENSFGGFSEELEEAMSPSEGHDDGLITVADGRESRAMILGEGVTLEGDLTIKLKIEFQ